MISVSPKELYDFLTARGIEYLYHADTVRTACALIKQKHLVSRGYMETKGISMTEQSSDCKDKQFDVWNDIFVDVVDLHTYFPRQNLYGPVCFKLSNKFLLDKDLDNICITKDNPMYWKVGMKETDKYFSSVKEYAKEFDSNMQNKCIQKKMITIHNTKIGISFDKYLYEIILDSLENKKIYDDARQALTNIMREVDLDVEILKERKCHNRCFCNQNYSALNEKQLLRLFEK